MKRIALAVAAILVLSAGAARAAGEPPHIDSADPLESIPGGIVAVTGTSFAEGIDQTTARLGNEAALVLEATRTHVIVRLPEKVKKGRYPLEVFVAGRSSNKVEIAVEDESKRDEKSLRDVKKWEGATSARLGKIKQILLDAPDPMFDRGRLKIRVSGQALFPDETSIQFCLRLDNDLITTTWLPVTGQRFEGAFDLGECELFAGNYWLDAVFNLNEQPRHVKMKFKEAYPDATEFATKEHAVARQACQIGTPEIGARQMKELREHLARSIGEVRTLLRDLESAYAGAGRAIFVSPSTHKVDEQAWEEWLAKSEPYPGQLSPQPGGGVLWRVPEQLRPARAAVLRKDSRFLNADGGLAEARWREWIDMKFRTDLYELTKSHNLYRAHYLVIKHPRSMNQLEELFGLLAELSQVRSSNLYAYLKLPVPAQDTGNAGMDIFRFGSGEAVSPGSIENGARRIIQEIGFGAEEMKLTNPKES